MKTNRICKHAIIFVVLLVLSLGGNLSPASAASATSSFNIPDSSTYVANMAVPAQHNFPESTEYPIVFPITVKIGDENGRQDITQYTYIAKVFNSSRTQVGGNIPLTLNPCEEGDPDHVFSIVGHGTAYIPSSIPEGDYYVFVYKIVNGNDFILPFMCNPCEDLKPCDSAMTELIWEGSLFTDSCSKFWCCGCECTEPQIKNKIHLKKTGREKQWFRYMFTGDQLEEVFDSAKTQILD